MLGWGSTQDIPLPHSGLLNRGPFPGRWSPPTVHILVVPGLERPQKGPWLPSHTWHQGAGLAAGVCVVGGNRGVRRRRVRGIVPCPGSAASSPGIFHLRSRGPVRSERALSPARHLARFRGSSPRRARSPPSPGRAPGSALGAGPPVRRPPLCPPADARAESEAPCPERPPRAGGVGLRA